MSRHIVALGGSLLRPEEAASRSQWFGQLRQLVVHLQGNGRRLGIVVGGGAPAREGIELARNSFSESYRLDMVGIAATRLNATILQQSLLGTKSATAHTTASRNCCAQNYIVWAQCSASPRNEGVTKVAQGPWHKPQQRLATRFHLPCVVSSLSAYSRAC